MKTFLVLDQVSARPDAESNTFPPEMVEAFLKRYTVSGDVVLDPFAGFGTTLVVAERMGRRAIGVEWHEDRADYIAGRIGPSSQIIHGDSRRIDELGLPVADFLMTSPPYMHRNDTEDPLQGYSVAGGGYDAYLAGVRDVFKRLRNVLKPDAISVVNVSNIKRWDGLTTLAWDIGNAISEVMTFEGEVMVCIENGDRVFGYDHEYCLVFRNQERRDEATRAIA